MDAELDGLTKAIYEALDAQLDFLIALDDRSNLQNLQPPAQDAQDAQQAALTDAQHRAVAEWQRRMGSATWEPHFLEAVFSERSNADAGLRASVRRLVRQGRIFRQDDDGRIQLLREPPAWQTLGDGLPF